VRSAWSPSARPSLVAAARPDLTTLPDAFRARRLLERLNVAGVGLSLSGATTALLVSMTGAMGSSALFVAAPTLAIGILWAALLRDPRKVSLGAWTANGRVREARLGWLLCVPLAMLNAGVAAGGLVMSDSGWSIGSFALGMLLGTTFGAMIWIPALMLTILCFGLPIERARRLAEQGLAGKDRGELWVGGASLLVTLLSLLVTASMLTEERAFRLGVVDLVLLLTVQIASAAVSGLATITAWRRERARKVFVTRVERGEVPQFRIEPTPQGKVLLRVPEGAASYRVSSFEEEVAALDAEGEVREVRG
jgi:hypothetical protein